MRGAVRLEVLVLIRVVVGGRRIAASAPASLDLEQVG
jgi:hypothetical protein